MCYHVFFNQLNVKIWYPSFSVLILEYSGEELLKDKRENKNNTNMWVFKLLINLTKSQNTPSEHHF